LRTKCNIVENLLKDTNNQLQASCLELVSHKQALQHRDKALATMNTQLLKLWIENNSLIAKSVEKVHFKTHNNLKALQTNFDRLTRDYGKMETINV